MDSTAKHGRPQSFRRFHVETISEDRGAELDRIYGTSGGIDSTLDAFRYVGAGDDEVSMRGADVDGARAGVMDPRTEHIVFWIGGGSAAVKDLRTDSSFNVSPGHPHVLSASVAYEFAADTRKVTMLHLSDRILRAALARRGTFARGPLHFQQQSDMRVALGPLRTILGSRVAEIMDGDTGAVQRRALNDEIANAVIDAFPLERRLGPKSNTSAGRAVTWIQQHAREAISLQDVADAVGISARGLQDAMRREHGESPMERLRIERLEGARQDLLANRDGTSVADIARRWQLTHLGRFAAAYADRFGERPSHTLKRSRHS